jgi:hypothetical protein
VGTVTYNSENLQIQKAVPRASPPVSRPPRGALRPPSPASLPAASARQSPRAARAARRALRRREVSGIRAASSGTVHGPAS